MNTAIIAILNNLKIVNSGEPWFGRAVYEILDEADPTKVFVKPDHTEHSLIEILYHMITWADFTLKRMQKDKINELAAAEELDWRTIDPKLHNWKKALTEFKAIHKKIIRLLEKKEDSF